MLDACRSGVSQPVGSQAVRGSCGSRTGAASPAPLVETVFSGHLQQVAPLAEKRYTFVACNVEKAVFVRIFRKNQRRDTLYIARVCVGSALQCNERNVSHTVAVGQPKVGAEVYVAAVSAAQLLGHRDRKLCHRMNAKELA